MRSDTKARMFTAFRNGDAKALETLFATDPDAAPVFDAHLDAALVYYAAIAGTVEFLRWLVARGADPNAFKGSDEIWTALHDYGRGTFPPSTPLFEAVRRERPDLVEALLALGARPDLAVQTPLGRTRERVEWMTPKLLAYQLGYADLVALLEARGAGEPIPPGLRLLRLIQTGTYREALTFYLGEHTAIDPAATWYHESPLSAALARLYWEARQHVQRTVLSPMVGSGESGAQGSPPDGEALDALVSLLEGCMEQGGLHLDPRESGIADSAVLLGDPHLLQLALRTDSLAEH